MPQFDSSVYFSQIFWMCISFGLLFWAIQTKLMPKISGLERQRAEKKNVLLDQASTTLDQAETLEQLTENSTQKAREAAAAVVSQAIKLRESRLQEELYARQESYQAQIGEVERTIEQERAHAWKTLYDSVPDLCELLTKKWSNKTLSKEEGAV